VKRQAAGLLIALGAASVGGLGAGELRVTLDGEAGYRSDGNYGQVDLGSEDLRDEGVARVGADLRLSYLLPRVELAFGYQPSYERSLEESELDGMAHRLDLGLFAALSRRTSFSIRERLQSSPNLDLYNPVDSPETIAVTERGDQLRHSLDASVSHGFTRRFSMNVGATHAARAYESAELFDSEALTARIGAGWALTEDREIGAAASAGRYDYDGRRETDVATFGVSYAQRVGRGGNFRIEAGLWQAESEVEPRPIPVDPTPGEVDPDEIDPDEGGLAGTEQVEETGWRGGVSFSRSQRRFSWSAGYSHDVSPGAGLGRAAEVDNAFLGVATPIGRRFTFGLDGNASRQTGAIGTQRELEDDTAATRFVAGTARVGWQLSQGFRLTGGYSRIWQRSRIEPFDDLSYNRFFVGLAFRIFKYGEPPWQPDRLGEDRIEDDRPGETSDEEPDAE
jgi:hypothetical protein